MKRLALTLALSLLSTVNSMPARAGTPLAERSDQVVDATGLTALEVRNARGPVRIRPSADGRLHVTATKICRLQRHADAAKYLAQTSVESRAEAGRWIVRVTYPKRIDSRIDFFELFREHSGGMEFPILEVQLVIEAPPAWAATLETASGDVDVQGLTGRLKIDTRSGDLAVADASGMLELSTASGDIELADVGRTRLHTSSGDVAIDGVGALVAESRSGDIAVDGARDSLRLTSASGDLRVSSAPRGIVAATLSGDVELRGAAGVVGVQTRSGDLELSLATGLKRCDASTSSGALNASLDPALSAALDLRTSSGEIACHAAVRTRSQDRHHLEATFGRGGAPVALQTVSGDLTLTSGGN